MTKCEYPNCESLATGVDASFDWACDLHKVQRGSLETRSQADMEAEMNHHMADAARWKSFAEFLGMGHPHGPKLKAEEFYAIAKRRGITT